MPALDFDSLSRISGAICLAGWLVLMLASYCRYGQPESTPGWWMVASHPILAASLIPLMIILAVLVPFCVIIFDVATGGRTAFKVMVVIVVALLGVLRFFSLRRRHRERPPGYLKLEYASLCAWSLAMLLMYAVPK